MRTAELLRALVQTPGGVEIVAVRDSVSVVTVYQPTVCGEGETLFAALRDVAVQILKRCEQVPSYKELCPDVLAALENYDAHSQRLQV